MIHIVNSLRFISQYSIVHMDLSLNNLLVCKEFFVKLIDFGEAYKMEICSKKCKIYLNSGYSPGYTIPFSPPETFNTKKVFSPEQDIFSFGMIFFRTLFESYPFQVTKKLEESYRDKSYEDRILFAP